MTHDLDKIAKSLTQSQRAALKDFRKDKNSRNDLVQAGLVKELFLMGLLVSDPQVGVTLHPDLLTIDFQLWTIFHHYNHLAVYPADEILSQRSIDPLEKEFEASNGKRYKVHMDSERYHVFARSKKCVCCGIEGSKMMLDFGPQQGEENKRPHFNLYAFCGSVPVLMTKDHIQPKSMSGPNHQKNYQTMCCQCNRLKSNEVLTLEALQVRPGVVSWMQRIRSEG